MHYVTKVQTGASDGRFAALAGAPATTHPPKQVTRVIRDLVQGAWRRRLLIVLPVLLMLPISIAASIILPKAYVARSLMQLQEVGRENPFSREGDSAGTIYRVQERFEGLRALFMSESVLAKALGADIEKLPPAERDGKIGDLRQALSLDLIGGDFIEVKLAGAKPEGLGMTLEAVMASFLEALVPEQGGATAAQLMVNARRRELDALIRSREDAQRELAALLPSGSEEAARQFTTLEAERRSKGEALARVETEIARLREVLGNPKDEQLEQEMAALLPTRPDQPLDERTQNLTALKSLSTLRQELSAETRDLGASASSLQQRITSFRDLQGRISSLDKEIASARESYESYQKRFSSTNTVRSVGILKAPELIRIVDPPRDPATASRSRLMYFISGIMAGGLLGLGLAFLAERLDRRIRHADEASEASGLPVLAVIRNQNGRPQPGKIRSKRDGKPTDLSAATG